jgi:carbamoyl-phosphate synthase large subunit
MQSTGEAIGIHEDQRVALAKALRGAALVPSRTGGSAVALLSIADRDKVQLPRLARALDRAGFRLAATDGTRAALRAAGFDAEPVAKLPGEDPAGGAVDGRLGRTGGLVDVVEFVRSGRAGLVVNTPTPRSGAVRDAAYIRHAAIAEGVLCLTAIETAVAAAEALAPEIAAQLTEVRPLAEWLGLDQAPVPVTSQAAVPGSELVSRS